MREIIYIIWGIFMSLSALFWAVEAQAAEQYPVKPIISFTGCGTRSGLRYLNSSIDAKSLCRFRQTNHCR